MRQTGKRIGTWIEAQVLLPLAWLLALSMAWLAVAGLIRYAEPSSPVTFLASIAEILGAIALAAGLWRYVAGEEDRLKAKHYQAWQVINSAHGNRGSGGRIDALRDLAQDGVSLAGVNLDRARLKRLV